MFHFGLLNKRDSFRFSIVRIPDNSSNVPSSIVYSATGAETLRIAKASYNPESFSTAIKPLIAHMNRNFKIFNKHHSNVCQSKQELLNLIS